MSSGKKSVCLISLGCPKNLVDSEHVLGFLQEAGFVPVSRPEEADTAVINTCGFIQAAVEETIDTILEVAAKKGKGKLERLFVMGCFVQRYGYKLVKEMPEVDGWLGTGEIDRIVEIMEAEEKERPPFVIGQPGYLGGDHVPRVQTSRFYSTYIKVAEGCSNACTYCTIPHLRGRLRSRGPESIFREAEAMAEGGVKEINLIAQDTTMYGKDLGGQVALEGLLEGLLDIRGLSWIRVLYCHPHRISDRLLELVNGENRICPYLDLPVQHVNPDILSAMGRGGHGETPCQLIARIKSKSRGIHLRTTVMIGFPGETEQSFEELCEFVRTARVDHLGAFIYSREEGTPASRLNNPVRRRVAQKRLDKVMGIQAEVSRQNNQDKVGQVLPVLIEGQSPETPLLLAGRTAGMAPDVDGRVLINKGRALVGDIVPVRIVEAHTYDLVGEIL
jgi:ribosomal protein S12 methylthiotransferase